MAEIPQIVERVEKSLEAFHFRDALKEAMNLARLGNKYLARYRTLESNQDGRGTGEDYFEYLFADFCQSFHVDGTVHAVLFPEIT